MFLSSLLFALFEELECFLTCLCCWKVCFQINSDCLHLQDQLKIISFCSRHIAIEVNLLSSYFCSYYSSIFYSIDLLKSYQLSCYLCFRLPKEHSSFLQLCRRSCYCYITDPVDLEQYLLDLKEISSCEIFGSELHQSMNSFEEPS